MNRSAFIETGMREGTCGYPAQNTAQISRNALASGFSDEYGDRGLAPRG